MRSLRLVLLSMSLLMLLPGCDFMRKLANRPTSEDIEAKRVEIQRYEEAARAKAIADSIEQARLDSIRRVELAQQEKDSTEAYAYLQKRCTISTAEKSGGIVSEGIDERYYIIVSSFRHQANAENYAERVSRYGDYSPILITYGNGMIAVGICPCNKIKDVMQAYIEVRKKRFCPRDAWILVNE